MKQGDFPWIHPTLAESAIAAGGKGGLLLVPVADLNLDPTNVRRHPEKNHAATRASLRRFGQRLPIVVQRDGSVGVLERRELNHSTPKPVGLFEIPITKHLKPTEICYEPFSGSGPQYIAAQKLGRRCFGLELMPPFVDTIVCRWQKATGKQAILDGDGRTFAEIAEARGVPLAG